MEAERAIRAHVLQLSGSLDLRCIDAARDRILDALRQHDAVTIDCSRLTAADLCAAQLLLAAHRSAEAWGKTLALMAPAGKPLRDVLVRGGFLPGDVTGTGNRFWNEGSASA